MRRLELLIRRGVCWVLVLFAYGLIHIGSEIVAFAAHLGDFDLPEGPTDDDDDFDTPAFS